MRKEKNYSVETLRGTAIILVVAGHVIGSASDGGMKVADDSAWRYFYYTFEYLRMPLFTVISGWVYALFPAEKGSFSPFIIKKARRILLPMIFVGTTYFLLQYFTPGTNMKGDLSQIWKIYIFPYTLYWFLPSLFLVFLVISILDIQKLLQRFNHWLLITAIAFVLFMLRDYFIPQTSPNIFSYKGAIYLLPFFLIGVGLNRFKQQFTSKYTLPVILTIFLIGFAIQQFFWFSSLDSEILENTGVSLIIGITGIVLLFRIKWNIPFLVYFGKYAYSIYLFHAFGTAGGRILLGYGGINHQVLVFILSTILGLGIPIIAEIILNRNPFTRMAFLGRSPGKVSLFRKPMKTSQAKAA